jgi:DNA helicase HerA-like ATPase
MLQLESRPGCTLIAGTSGSGKTTFALRYLVARQDVTCRFLFEEPKRDLTLRLRLPDAETAEELEVAAADGWAIYYPATMFPGDWAAGLDWFTGWSYAAAAAMPGRKILFVDEVWKYSDPARLPSGLARWIQDGRSFGLETVFVTQRPNRLNEGITNEATELVTFRLQGANALSRVKELGADPEEVRDLPPGSFTALNCETGATLRGRLW